MKIPQQREILQCSYPPLHTIRSFNSGSLPLPTVSSPPWGALPALKLAFQENLSMCNWKKQAILFVKCVCVNLSLLKMQAQVAELSSSASKQHWHLQLRAQTLKKQVAHASSVESYPTSRTLYPLPAWAPDLSGTTEQWLSYPENLEPLMCF